MPIILDKKSDCCGCGACVAICPHSAIIMAQDEEGFHIPQIDMGRCTDCGLCTKACPQRELFALHDRIVPPTVKAAWHLDNEVRRQSSSGGVFSALAEDILARCGVVIGSAFNRNLVCQHIVIETMQDLARLRGSKYVQSRIDANVFATIRDALKAGRHVLFCGTPCQVAGLRKCLKLEHDNLFCCDLVCHGVPSPRFLEKHISGLIRFGKRLTDFSFRDKQQGWKAFRLLMKWEGGSSKRMQMYADPFMAAFLKNYSLRESCYSCHYTTTERQGDLTIADFWGVGDRYPEYDLDDKGTSLLLVNTRKGAALLERCSHRLFMGNAELEHALSSNPMLKRPAARPPARSRFYEDAAIMSIRQLSRKYRLHHPVPLYRRTLGTLKRGALHATRSLLAKFCPLIIARSK